MKRIFAIIFLVALICSSAQATWRSKVRAGDKLYEKGQYDEALIKYLEALNEKGDSTLISFNLGNVFQAQEKFEDAGKSFLPALTSPDSALRAEALYNLGNALFGQEKYDEAVEAYKSALRLQPRQMDYLHNLQLAEYLKQRQQEQQQQQNQKQNQQQNKDQQQDQQQQDREQQKEQQQEQQEEQNQQEEQQQDQQTQEEEQQPQQAQADSLMSPEDALRLLNALMSDEKQVQENLHRKQPVEGEVGKDW